MKVDKPNDNNEFISEIAKQNLFFSTSLFNLET